MLTRTIYFLAVEMSELSFLGEILRMTHIARGLDSDGALLLDVVVSGYVLQLQSPAEVTVKVKCSDNMPSLCIGGMLRVRVKDQKKSIEILCSFPCLLWGINV